MLTRRSLARPGMPQTKPSTACSFLPQLVQRSSWFEGFRAKYRLREQDTNHRRGQPFARIVTGVGGRPSGRSTSGRQARGCAPVKTPMSIGITWIVAGIVSTRATHRNAPRIGHTRTSSSKSFSRSTTVFVKPILTGETPALTTSAV